MSRILMVGIFCVCYINKFVTFTDEYNTVTAKNSSNSSSPTTLITTPAQASTEFGILLSNIIRELKYREEDNLVIIKDVCSALTIKDDPGILLFNEDQREAIDACDNVRTMFTKNLRGCWRWDDFSLLKTLVQGLESSERCEAMLNQFEEKLDSQMKLQQIYEHCIQEKRDIPDGYDKMVAIVRNKIFSRITKEEYDKLKEFISSHLEVKSYVIPPFYKAAYSSLVLEFFIPVTSTTHLVEMATKHMDDFVKESFVYLRISLTLIFDLRQNVSKLM